MSDARPLGVWQSNALLYRPQDAPQFLRHNWDEKLAHSFGPWRISGQADPLQGQTEALALPNESEAQAATELTAEPVGHQDLGETATPSLPLAEQPEVQALLEQAREEGRQQGHEAALASLTEEAEKERQALQSIAASLNEWQSDPQRWLEPLKKLSIHVAQELVRGELRTDTAVIERLIHACVEALEQPAQSTIVLLSPSDLHRLKEIHLPGVSLEVDESLSEGSVRVKVADTQVQDLIEHRLAELSRQLLGDAPA